MTDDSLPSDTSDAERGRPFPALTKTATVLPKRRVKNVEGANFGTQISDSGTKSGTSDIPSWKISKEGMGTAMSLKGVVHLGGGCVYSESNTNF